jgi:hypothetical protein
MEDTVERRKLPALVPFTPHQFYADEDCSRLSNQGAQTRRGLGDSSRPVRYLLWNVIRSAAGLRDPARLVGYLPWNVIGSAAGNLGGSGKSGDK